jgi:hypothetical protein
MESIYPGRGSHSRRVAAWIALLAIALGVRVGLAIHFPSMLHPDEVFQTLEPAHRLAYGYGVVSWEWREGVRSWVLPTFLAGLMRATGWMGPGATGYTYAITILLSLISLSAVWFGYAWARRVSGREAACIAAGACAFLIGMVDLAPKALTEVVAAHILLPGLYLGFYGDRIGEKKRFFLAAILCGLAASLRIQLIPAAAFAVLYFCYPRWRQRIPVAAAGFSIPVLAFGVVDKLTWSYPWQSFIRYFQINVTEGRSLDYGIKPWYWYLLVLLLLLGPMVVFLWKGARRSPLLAVVALIILGSHSLLGHKEIRFIYPVLPLAITLSAIGFTDSLASLRTRWKLREFSLSVVAAGVLCFVLSSAFLIPKLITSYKASGALVAMDHAGRDAEICGVGIALDEISWWKPGGYSHLHRDIPIVPVMNRADLLSKSPAINALIASASSSEAPEAFVKSDCWHGVCLYRRAGACSAPQAEDTLNEFLRRTSQ